MNAAVEPRNTDLAAKRVLDVILSAAALLVLSPLLLVLAVLVRFSSPGPIFFSQVRVGRLGKEFKIYKFRSMTVSTGGPLVTAGSDKRITPIGAFLRRKKLDELPQFFNVFLGDMSLVGPRPEVPKYVAYYSEKERGVLVVRPGITGPTQLNYTDEEELLAAADDPETYYIEVLLKKKLEMDLEYVATRNLGMDIQMLWKTFARIVSRK